CNIDNQVRQGGRFTAGFYCNDCQSCGLEGSFLFLSSRAAHFTATGSGAPGSPTTARPFFNVITGAEDSELESAANLLSGTTNFSLSSRLWGAELNLISMLCCCCECGRGYQLEGLAGFRYLQLNEGLQITEDLHVLPQPLIAGADILLQDRFD